MEKQKVKCEDCAHYDGVMLCKMRSILVKGHKSKYCKDFCVKPEKVKERVEEPKEEIIKKETQKPEVIKEEIKEKIEVKPKISWLKRILQKIKHLFKWR